MSPLIYPPISNFDLYFSEDDVFLLRLVTKTGPCLKRLQEKTALLVLSRLNQILSGDYLSAMALDLFEEGLEHRLLDNLLSQEQQNLEDLLLQMSEAPNQTTGEKAAHIDLQLPENPGARQFTQ